MITLTITITKKSQLK